VKETGYKPVGLNFLLTPGLQLNVEVADNTQLTVRPQFVFPLFAANSSSQRHHLYSFAAEIGFLFNLSGKKAESD
jgi:hypothetical protein